MNVVSAMRTEFDRARKWLLFSLGLKFLIVGISLFSLRAGDGSAFPKFTLVFAALAQLALFFCRWRSTEHQSFGNQLRLDALLEHGLGVGLSPLTEARVHQRIGPFDENADTSTYYASTLPAGPMRLVDDVAESAFFTAALARRSFTILIGVITVAVVALVFGFTSLVLVGASEDSLQLASRVVILAVTFWVADDLILIASTYYGVFRDCDQILQKADVFFSCSAKNPLQDAYSILCDYHLAAGISPPFAATLYKRLNTRLSKTWESIRVRRSTLGGGRG